MSRTMRWEITETYEYTMSDAELADCVDEDAIEQFCIDREGEATRIDASTAFQGSS